MTSLDVLKLAARIVVRCIRLDNPLVVYTLEPANVFRMTSIIQRDALSFNEKKGELPLHTHTRHVLILAEHVCIHGAIRCRSLVSHSAHVCRASRNRHAKFRAAQFRVVQHRNRIFVRVAVVTPTIFGKN